MWTEYRWEAILQWDKWRIVVGVSRNVKNGVAYENVKRRHRAKGKMASGSV